MTARAQHVFTAVVDLPGLTDEQAKTVNRELQVAVYDVLDDADIDYQSLVLKVINADDVVEEWEQGSGKRSVGGFRSSDPDTSRKGALDAYPRSASQRHKALLAIARSGDKGMTYEEVEQATSMNDIWKRLSELRDGGWIYEAGERVVKGTGSQATIWKMTTRAERHIETKERAGVIE